jgi:hypothetical protein
LLKIKKGHSDLFGEICGYPISISNTEECTILW